jgi:hypothetical protein
MDGVKIVLILLLIWVIMKKQGPEGLQVRRVESCNGTDGRCYGVVADRPEGSHKDASELLAYLNGFSLKFLRHVRAKYVWDRGPDDYRREMFVFLLANYNPDNIVENAPVDPGATSYVEDKGKVFALCLREYQNGSDKFLSKHILEFVTLHEMTHMATKSIGHGPDFWLNFKIILQEANLMGLHTPINYAKAPVNYCTLDVDYSPFFDETIPTPG